MSNGGINTNQVFPLYEGDFTPYIHSTYIIRWKDAIYMCVKNTIFCMNEMVQHWEKIGTIPQQYGRKNSSDYSRGIYGDALLFWNYDPIGVYRFDLKKREGEEYVFGKSEKEYLYYDLYCMQVESQNYSVIVPMNGEKIILFDKESLSYIIYETWREELDDYLISQNLSFDRIRYQDIAIDHDLLYMNVATDKKGIFIAVNIDSGTLKQVVELDCQGQIFGCLLVKGYLYFQEKSKTKNTIVRWWLQQNCVDKIWNIPNVQEDRGDLFLCGNNVILCSRDGGIYRVNEKTKIISKIFQNPIFFQNHTYEMMPEEAFLIDGNGIYLWDTAKDILPKPLSIPWLNLFLQSI